MEVIGTVKSLYRYPVKSMRGEMLTDAFAGFAGIYGDRVYAFSDAGAPAGFPFLTSREQQQMLLYRPSYRFPARMRRPPNLDEADALAPGATPMYASAADAALDVETPRGEKFAIDDPILLQRLSDNLADRHELALLRSDRSMTDCRPISLFNIWTARQLSDETGTAIDERRFRANVYLDLASREGFAENALVGRTLRVGSRVTITVVDLDPRCKMITLDPDTAEQNPEIMRCVARRHDGKAGLYAAVLVEGMICPGDQVAVLN